jgi:citrate lyase subunit beta/citryl-CoA lyase
VPAHEDRKVEKALLSDADTVILDLEDSVPESEKDNARCAVGRWLDWSRRDAGCSNVWVRVNEADSPHFARDLVGVPWDRVAGAVVPKAEDPQACAQLDAAGAPKIILLVESVHGLASLERLVAATPRVHRLAIGTFDLCCDLGLVTVDDPDDSELIWQIRGQLVIESRRLGLEAPIDGIFARLDDDDGLRRVCERVMRMGYGGKLLIHPGQIPVAASVFVPKSETLEMARDVVAVYDAAMADGRGAISVGGRLVDRPMVARARAMLARWEEDAR